jgi:hypothetical protein
MESSETQPMTFVEMVLERLEDRFPWLGKNESASGADTVDQLNDLHEVLRKARAIARRKKSTRR